MERPTRRGTRPLRQGAQHRVQLVLRVQRVCILLSWGREFNGNPSPMSSSTTLTPSSATRPILPRQIGLSKANGPLERAVMTDPEAMSGTRRRQPRLNGNPSARRSSPTRLRRRRDRQTLCRTSLFNLDFLKRYSVGRTARRGLRGHSLLRQSCFESLPRRSSSNSRIHESQDFDVSPLRAVPENSALHYVRCVESPPWFQVSALSSESPRSRLSK